MRSCLIAILLFANTCFGQKWMGEFSIGGAEYSGDLAPKGFTINRLRPAAGFNLKYESGDLLNFRTGVTWTILTADDNDNKEPTTAIRNLNFTTHLFEWHAAFEFNIMDPELYTAYPYIFGGAGLFYFNPYSFDNDNKKVFLQPLSTEGQGLSEYPDRKKYSLLQVCVPFGAGMKWITKNKNQIAVEFGYRLCFTDYIDDVSKTYVDPEILKTKVSPKSAEMSYRKIGGTFSELGLPRGNSANKDLYYVGSLKYSFYLKKPKSSEKKVEEKKSETKKKKKNKKK